MPFHCSQFLVTHHYIIIILKIGSTWSKEHLQELACKETAAIGICIINKFLMPTLICKEIL